MKILKTVALSLVLLLCAGCGSSGKAVLPPVRETEEQLTTVQRETVYTVETAWEDAELVAVVRIGDWLNESENGYGSFYRAKTEKIFKGTAPEEIVIVQDGNSKATLRGYPLFTDGNEMLMFLKAANEEGYENDYYLIGSYTTLFDVAHDGDAAYYLDRYGILGESVTGCDNLLFDAAIREKLSGDLAKKDPAAEGRRYHFIFSADQFDALLETVKSEERNPE